MTRQVVVGLGSNLGSRLTTLRCAVDMLAADGSVRLMATSRVYETDPVGPPQPRFLNAAALLETDRSLPSLLDLALEVERALGRERRERWGPRLLDLDLLYASGERVDSEGLTVPHPRLTERPFALAPLLDVLPDAPAELRRTLDRLGGPPQVWDELGAPVPPWRTERIGPELSIEAAAEDSIDALAQALSGLGRELSGEGGRSSESRVGGCVDGEDPSAALNVLAEALGEGFRVRWVTLAGEGAQLSVRIVGSRGDPARQAPRPRQASVHESRDGPTARLAVTVGGAGVDPAK